MSNLTKEELEQALLNLHCYAIYDAYEHEQKELDADMCKLKQLINEHFDSSETRVETRDNPPLKFEELKEGMWVWDNKYKDYVKFKRYDIDDVVGKLLILSKGFDDEFLRIFRENRFYRKQVEE